MLHYCHSIVMSGLLLAGWSLTATPLSLLPGTNDVRLIPQTDFKDAAIKDGVFTGTLISGMASLITSDLKAPAVENGVLSVTVKSSYTGDGALAVYWADAADPVFRAEKKLLLSYSAMPQWQTIQIPVGLSPDWSGTIVKLRIDVVGATGATVQLKGIGFTGLSSDPVRQIFPGSIYLSGFTGFQSFVQNDRQISFTLLENHAYTRPVPIVFRAAQYPLLKIRYKTEDTDTVMFVVYFGTLANPAYSEQQVVRTPGEPAEEFQTAVIKLSQCPNFTGVISSFRLDFIADEGSVFKIESIVLAQE